MFSFEKKKCNLTLVYAFQNNTKHFMKHIRIVLSIKLYVQPGIQNKSEFLLYINIVINKISMSYRCHTGHKSAMNNN